MLRLEAIITKSAEEVYGTFVNSRFLLEEDFPKAILTDNGREFSSKLLRELMRLCRIRLQSTRCRTTRVVTTRSVPTGSLEVLAARAPYPPALGLGAREQRAGGDGRDERNDTKSTTKSGA